MKPAIGFCAATISGAEQYTLRLRRISCCKRDTKSRYSLREMRTRQTTTFTTIVGCFVSFVVSVLMLGRLISQGAVPAPATTIHATRIPQNPLITVTSSSTLGDNVNGPSILRVP